MRNHLRLSHKLIILVVLTAAVSVCVPSMLVIQVSTRSVERQVADLTRSQARSGALAVQLQINDTIREVIGLSDRLSELEPGRDRREAVVRDWLTKNPDAMMAGADDRAPGGGWHTPRDVDTVNRAIPLTVDLREHPAYGQVQVHLERHENDPPLLVMTANRQGRIRVVTKWRLDPFSVLLRDSRVGPTGYLMLVDHHGPQLAPPRSGGRDGAEAAARAAGMIGMDLKHLDLVRDAFLREEPTTARLKRYENEVGHRVVADAALVPGPAGSADHALRWAVIAQEPEGEAVRDIVSMKRQVLLWGSTTGLVAVLLGLAIVGQITRPLETLAEAANRVGEGDLTHPVGVGTQDEIGLLALAFNEMQVRLREMYQKLERMVEERTHELQETTDFLNSVLDSSTEYSIIATDLHGTILSYNEGARRIYGYEPEEIIGAPVQIVIPREPGEAAKSREILRQVRREGTFSGETAHVRKGGRRFPVRFVQTLRYDDNGNPVGYTTITSDITRRKELEAKLLEYTGNLESLVASKTQELQNANIQLERANQLKGEFLASMSHELRTPLNAIIGFADVLREELAGPLNDEQKQFVRDILESGRQLLNLINDILDLSKVDAGRMNLDVETVELSSVFDEVQTIIQGMAVRKNLSLAFREQPPGILLRVDRLKLLQILYNLLSNAVKFTPKGGSVRAEAEWRDTDTCFRVIDTGVGIPADKLDLVFEEFRQVDSRLSREYGGTGLGLALTRKLVDLHGGKLSVESQVDRGSTFTFTIPHALPTDGQASDVLTDRADESA
jgi:PAS domain S-box-containing protein